MDQIKKRKGIQLKLNVNISDVEPESTHSHKKQSEDLFFNVPLDSDVEDNNQLYLHNGRIVADAAQMRCGRKKQEDRFVAIPNLGKNEEFQFYYAVFDGHGGNLISRILAQSLHVQLVEDQNFRVNIPQAVMQSFEKMNRTILTLQEEQQIDGGSTALCVLNEGRTLYVMNVGDSTCVLVKEDFTLTKLNSEHKLNREDEFKRVEQVATILDRQYYTCLNRQIPRINGEIAVTRSFGDKKHRQCGLIAEPEITQHTILEDDRYIILASDGFWDIIRFEELQKLLEGWNSKSVEMMSQYLLDAAAQRNTNFKKDNMTLIIIDLKMYWQ